MTEQRDDDDLSPELSAALAVASWAVTAPACCPRCRQVFVHCAACGELCCLRVPPDDDLPAALSGECVSCGTPGLITVAGWLNPTPKPKVKANGELPLSSTKIAAHLERCLRSADGQRSTPPRAATPSRRPLPSRLQQQIADRLRRGAGAKHTRHPVDHWQKAIPLRSGTFPVPTAMAASYRRLTGLNPQVAMPARTPAIYSASEAIACLAELGVPLLNRNVGMSSQLARLHHWITSELQPYRSNI